MERLITKDGSTTFWSEEYKELYHSGSGAIEEAQKKFIEPSNVAKLAKRGHFSILDICFGLGYKSLVAIHTIKKTNPNCKIFIAALEKDVKILGTVVDMLPELQKDYLLLRELVSQALKSSQTVRKQNTSLNLLIGDARTTIKTLNSRFDAISLDPFSPKKNPELWTLEFFQDIFTRCKKGTVLTTYSCASSVRKNLKEAGFSVSDGPCLHRRGPSTVAIVPGKLKD